jgi:hypothetical protein
LAVPRFSLVSGPENLRIFDEKASQTFKRGDILVLSSNQVKLATGTGISADMLGVAAADASGTTAADIPVYVFSSEQVWRALPNTAKKPTSFSLGVDYKIKQTAVGAGEVSTAAGADAIVYSYSAEGNDGTTAGDPMLIKIDTSNIAMAQGG